MANVRLSVISSFYKHYSDVCDAANENYDKAVKEANSNMNTNSKAYLDTVAAAKAQRDGLIKAAQDEGYAKAMDALNETREAVREFVTAPVPDNFTNTVTALTLIEKPSQSEVDDIMSRFASNYLAYRAICNAIGGKASHEVYKAFPVDSIYA